MTSNYDHDSEILIDLGAASLVTKGASANGSDQFNLPRGAGISDED